MTEYLYSVITNIGTWSAILKTNTFDMAKKGRRKKVNHAKLSDKQAKDILLTWPKRTNSVWKTPKKEGYWIQAQPILNGKSPILVIPGTKKYKSQPDGLWVYFHDVDFVDIICIEVCNSSQNLNDKRSRYIATTSTVLLKCPTTWFTGTINLGKKINKIKKTRWEACGTIGHIDENQVDYKFPIRTIRVLFALSDKLYQDWSNQIVPMAHEYICSHTSIRSINSQSFKDFIGQLSISKHYYTMKKK